MSSIGVYRWARMLASARSKKDAQVSRRNDYRDERSIHLREFFLFAARALRCEGAQGGDRTYRLQWTPAVRGKRPSRARSAPSSQLSCCCRSCARAFRRTFRTGHGLPMRRGCTRNSSKAGKHGSTTGGTPESVPDRTPLLSRNGVGHAGPGAAGRARVALAGHLRGRVCRVDPVRSADLWTQLGRLRVRGDLRGGAARPHQADRRTPPIPPSLCGVPAVRPGPARRRSEPAMVCCGRARGRDHGIAGAVPGVRRRVRAGGARLRRGRASRGPGVGLLSVPLLLPTLVGPTVNAHGGDGILAQQRAVIAWERVQSSDLWER